MSTSFLVLGNLFNSETLDCPIFIMPKYFLKSWVFSTLVFDTSGEPLLKSKILLLDYYRLLSSPLLLLLIARFWISPLLTLLNTLFTLFCYFPLAHFVSFFICISLLVILISYLLCIIILFLFLRTSFSFSFLLLRASLYFMNFSDVGTESSLDTLLLDTLYSLDKL
jgi:hypothetical protein